MSLSQANLMAQMPAKYNFFSANTAGTQVITGSGVLYGWYGQTVGTSWLITVYDNTSAAGSTLLNLTNTASTWFGVTGANGPPLGVVFTTGLFFVASGTAGTGILVWQSFQ